MVPLGVGCRLVFEDRSPTQNVGDLQSLLAKTARKMCEKMFEKGDVDLVFTA